MKHISKEELTVCLRNHALWLIGDPEGRHADLSEVNLSGVNLSGANLAGVDLSGADLSGALMAGTNLYRANLSGANLSGVYPFEANLFGANLSEAIISETYPPLVCPEKGSFTAFKKVGEHIVELLIPEDALRSSATSRKCRCSKAKVVSITNLDGSSTDICELTSGHDDTFIYRVGETVSVDNFDKNRWNECAPGIHFFITRYEAVE